MKTNRLTGWYCKAQSSNKWQEVLKIVPVYAADFDTAKKNGLIDKNNCIIANDKKIKIDNESMICRDENYNIWTEKSDSFHKRYKKTKMMFDFWHKYIPTREATNFAKPRNDSSIVDMRSHGGNEWQITMSEFKGHYRKV